MAMSTETAKVPAPPYVSYSTFKSFIGTLRDTVVPDHIDRSMMSNMSGGTQSHLLVALRYLGLVEGEDDCVSNDLRQLVDAYGDPERWKQVLETVLKSSYSGIIGDIDPRTATDQRMRKAFRDHAHAGSSTLNRCVRFYVKALEDAGVPVSPHLTRRKPRQTKPRPPLNGGRRTERGDDDNSIEKQSRGRDAGPSIPVFLGERREGQIMFPADLTEDECDKFAAAVEYLRHLAK